MATTRAMQPHFSAAFFQFMRQLGKNNDREWFAAHKPAFEEHVKGPMLRFITDLRPRMAKISRHIMVDPKPVGGSLHRMNRDTRFSTNKDPYRTCVTAMFGHDGGGKRDDLMLGYRLSIAPTPGEIKAHVGLWEPDSAALDAVRARILSRPDEWKKAIGGTFASRYRFEGESLKRAPKVGGVAVAADHPMMEDFKRKSHAAAVTFDEKTVCTAGFIDEYVEVVKAGSPLMAVLCGSLGLRY